MSIINLTNNEMFKITSFRELALRYLDSYNPKPNRAIVIANCILDYDDLSELMSTLNMRYLAHDFVQYAYDIIENKKSIMEGANDIDKWIIRWDNIHGA